MQHRFVFVIARHCYLSGDITCRNGRYLIASGAFESERATLSDYARTTLYPANATINEAETTLRILNREN